MLLSITPKSLATLRLLRERGEMPSINELALELGVKWDTARQHVELWALLGQIETDTGPHSSIITRHVGGKLDLSRLD